MKRLVSTLLLLCLSSIQAADNNRNAGHFTAGINAGHFTAGIIAGGALGSIIGAILYNARKDSANKKSPSPMPAKNAKIGNIPSLSSGFAYCLPLLMTIPATFLIASSLDNGKVSSPRNLAAGCTLLAAGISINAANNCYAFKVIDAQNKKIDALSSLAIENRRQINANRDSIRDQSAFNLDVCRSLDTVENRQNSMGITLWGLATLSQQNRALINSMHPTIQVQIIVHGFQQNDDLGE